MYSVPQLDTGSPSEIPCVAKDCAYPASYVIVLFYDSVMNSIIDQAFRIFRHPSRLHIFYIPVLQRPNQRYALVGLPTFTAASLYPNECAVLFSGPTVFSPPILTQPTTFYHTACNVCCKSIQAQLQKLTAQFCCAVKLPQLVPRLIDVTLRCCGYLESKLCDVTSVRPP